MADYIYLLQNRLSAAQQSALQAIRDVAKSNNLTVFLVGGAVRDLTSGSPVRDLDVVVQGNALKLKKEVELAGAVLAGEVASWQAFFAHFPGGVRMEMGSTLSVTYPKPGKPVALAATILDDLRRRDFTANAMALSLNDGSYGLLMDPLNGVADIENRQLRLVSNYGFIEDPVRMIRAARFSARLGWIMDEKTQARYETGKAEKYIGALSNVHRGYETEEIFHEEDPLRVLRKLEEEGWMKHLFPAMTTAKANVAELDRLREIQTQLQVSGMNPDPSAANFPLLTAKLSASDIAELKKSFVRPGFVREIESLEAGAKEFASQLSGKGATLPSQAWKLIHSAKPEAALWAAYSSKNPAIQAKLKSFHTEWPKARQKMPFALMQEMRIVPELDTFNEVVEKVFFELMDGNLTTPEEQKAFLEPFSPPAPPPPVRLARSRAGKKDSKASKSKKKAAELVDEDEDDLDRDHDQDHDEDRVEAVLQPDDENEDTPAAAAMMEEEAEAIVDAPEPESAVVPESEPVTVQEPEPVTAPVPVRSASRATRSEPAPAKVVTPIAAEPQPAITPAPPAKVIASVSDRKPVLAAVKVAPVRAAEKATPSPVMPAKGAVASAKAAATTAKKPVIAAAPAKATKALEAPHMPARKASEKQVPVSAKKTVPVKPAPVGKAPVPKAAAAPARSSGKKGR